MLWAPLSLARVRVAKPARALGTSPTLCQVRHTFFFFPQAPNLFPDLLYTSIAFPRCPFSVFCLSPLSSLFSQALVLALPALSSYHGPFPSTISKQGLMFLKDSSVIMGTCHSQPAGFPIALLNRPFRLQYVCHGQRPLEQPLAEGLCLGSSSQRRPGVSAVQLCDLHPSSIVPGGFPNRTAASRGDGCICGT